MKGLQVTLSTELLINDGLLRYGTQKHEAACCSSARCWEQSKFAQTNFAILEGKSPWFLLKMKCHVSRLTADSTLFLAVRKRGFKYWQYFLCSARGLRGHTPLLPLSFHTLTFAFLHSATLCLESRKSEYFLRWSKFLFNTSLDLVHICKLPFWFLLFAFSNPPFCLTAVHRREVGLQEENEQLDATWGGCGNWDLSSKSIQKGIIFKSSFMFLLKLYLNGIRPMSNTYLISLTIVRPLLAYDISVY